MAGKLARLTEGAPWARYLLSQLYTSIAFALAQNKLLLSKASLEFKKLAKIISAKITPTEKLNKEHQSIVRFALKKAAKMIHNSPAEYNIVVSMREEIELFKKMLEPTSSVAWEAPIAYLIKKTPFAIAYGDACLDAAGGFSVDLLKFWWHLEFPEAVIRHTLKYLKDNTNKNLISINVLEFVTVIIDYCAAYTVITTQNVTDDPHPVLLSMADNTSAHSWTNHTCKGSLLGK